MNMKKITKILFGGTVFFMVLFSSSCSRPSTETTQSPEAAALPLEENTTPEYGGVFTIAYAAEQRGFDSATLNWAMVEHLKQTGNTLIQGDWAKGPSGEHLADFDISTPPLAVSIGGPIESWDFAGDDTIILHVRRGVHFGLNPELEASRLVNGREMTAGDIAFTLRRQFNMEPSVSLPNAYALARLTPDEYPSSVKALDEWTVEVKGKPEFIGSLFYWITEMVPVYTPEVVQKYGDLNNIRNDVGTGPFVLKDYVQNSSMTFTRNQNYWEKDPYGAGKGNQLPYLDSVRYLIIPDLSTQLSAFRTGKIDYIRDVSLDDYKQLVGENPKLKSARIVGYPSGIALRSDRPDQPWYKLKVRQALQMAVDRDAIINDFFEGEAELLAFPIAPRTLFKSLGAYRELESLPSNVQELFKYNPEKAKQLLAEAGYPNGFTIEVILNAEQIDLASILQYQLEKIGVKLDLQVKENTVYTSINTGRTHAQGIFGSNFGNTPHAFHDFRPTDPGNLAMIDDPQVNEMIARFAEGFMIDDEKAWPLMGEYTPHILEQSWILFLPAPYTYTLWWPWVKNFSGEYSLGAGHFNNFPRYIWIDQDLKKTMGY
jgi:peptide/nickel transport system substrate-binding protein